MRDIILNVSSRDVSECPYSKMFLSSAPIVYSKRQTSPVQFTLFSPSPLVVNILEVALTRRFTNDNRRVTMTGLKVTFLRWLSSTRSWNGIENYNTFDARGTHSMTKLTFHFKLRQERRKTRPASAASTLIFPRLARDEIVIFRPPSSHQILNRDDIANDPARTQISFTSEPSLLYHQVLIICWSLTEWLACMTRQRCALRQIRHFCITTP